MKTSELVSISERMLKTRREGGSCSPTPINLPAPGTSTYSAAINKASVCHPNVIYSESTSKELGSSQKVDVLTDDRLIV